MRPRYRGQALEGDVRRNGDADSGNKNDGFRQKDAFLAVSSVLASRQHHLSTSVPTATILLEESTDERNRKAADEMLWAKAHPKAGWMKRTTHYLSGLPGKVAALGKPISNAFVTGMEKVGVFQKDELPEMQPNATRLALMTDSLQTNERNRQEGAFDSAYSVPISFHEPTRRIPSESRAIAESANLRTEHEAQFAAFEIKCRAELEAINGELRALNNQRAEALGRQQQIQAQTLALSAAASAVPHSPAGLPPAYFPLNLSYPTSMPPQITAGHITAGPMPMPSPPAAVPHLVGHQASRADGQPPSMHHLNAMQPQDFPQPERYQPGHQALRAQTAGAQMLRAHMSGPTGVPGA